MGRLIHSSGFLCGLRAKLGPKSSVVEIDTEGSRPDMRLVHEFPRIHHSGIAQDLSLAVDGVGDPDGFCGGWALSPAFSQLG